MNRVPSYTTSYKFFYNKNICFVSSAKLGTRFFKKLIENDNWNDYSYPMNSKFYGLEYDNQPYWKPDIDGYFDYVNNEIFTKTDSIAFLIRHPHDRFCSGVSTLLDIYHLRFFKYDEDGVDFLRTTFPNNISENELKEQALVLKKLLGEFYETSNPDILKKIIYDYIIKETIYKDAHVEHHHGLLYPYMKRVKKCNPNINWIDLGDLDAYIKSKYTQIDNNSEEYVLSKNSSKKSLPYDVLKNNLSAWKSENNELDLYLHIELENYDKIRKEYEILL